MGAAQAIVGIRRRRIEAHQVIDGRQYVFGIERSQRRIAGVGVGRANYPALLDAGAGEEAAISM